MKKLVFLLLILPFAVFAQEAPTHFEHNLSWAQVKEKAKKEHKFLFVDCFTTWCGPCKYMASEIFPQPKVGAFFNKNFVNVKVQLDKTPQDNEEVKSWYADGEKIAKDYTVRAYPTFLIFSPEGELVHKVVGGGDADNFIGRVSKALKPETQYITLLKKYEAGDRKPELLKELTYAAESAYEMDIRSKASADYLATQTDLYTKENLEFLGRFATSSKSKGFDILLKNPEKVDAILGAGTSTRLLSEIIINEDVLPVLKSDKPVNFDELATNLKAKYPSVDVSKEIKLTEIQYYQQQKNWPKFQSATLSYMAKYGKDANPGQLNHFAWTVFENCTDPACVAEALAWSKRSVEETNSKEVAFLDTYANLLHKSGKTKEAIIVEEQALAIVPAEEKANYQAVIDKMKKGEKTW